MTWLASMVDVIAMNADVDINMNVARHNKGKHVLWNHDAVAIIIDYLIYLFTIFVVRLSI